MLKLDSSCKLMVSNPSKPATCLKFDFLPKYNPIIQRLLFHDELFLKREPIGVVL